MLKILLILSLAAISHAQSSCLDTCHNIAMKRCIPKCQQNGKSLDQCNKACSERIKKPCQEKCN